MNREVKMPKLAVLLNGLAASIQNQLWILDPATLRNQAGATSPAAGGTLFPLFMKLLDNFSIHD